MKRTVLATAIALACVNAYGLQGTVIDKQGLPIEGAKVKANGIKQSVTTDAQGRFDIGDNIQEVHITAPGYSHRIVHVHDQGEEPLVIRLANTTIEQVDVIGLPIHASIIESALPVSVLSGEDLRNQQAATLGDSLDRLPGVNSNFHGNVASTPVIRGLSGPRVLITQNGLDVSDVSRVGPDHSVASEVSTAQQVEVLRGPATLFYGSGAIGGVVNVVDQRVPSENDTRGEFLLSRESVNKQHLASFNVTSGFDNFAVYADGFVRDADNYTSPVNPEQDHDEHDHKEDEHEGEEHENEAHKDEQGGRFTVPNSAEESNGFTLGASYLLDNGYVGFSVGQLNRQYGIPGHSHGAEEHEEHKEEHEAGEHKEEEHEEAVLADLEQTRYQLLSQLDVDVLGLRSIHTRAAYTDYTHAEIEEGEIGTSFSNKTTELRVDFLHKEWAHWKGAVNLHYKKSDLAANGEEAFTPPSSTETFALALMEEKHWGNVLFQLGARVEHVNVGATNVLLPHIELHSHDEEEGEDAQEIHSEEDTRVFAVNQDFKPVSLSLGAVWDFTPGYNVGLSLSRAQRAPSAAELLSFGPHIGTRSYEVGSLFALHQEGDETHFELSDAPIELETSNNIDISFRKHEGDLGIVFNVFYNRINDYYYQSNTGFFAEAGHDHDHDDEATPTEETENKEDTHSDELPIFLFSHEDAKLYGFELQTLWKINDHWKTTVFADTVKAQLTNGTDLPRIPPLRFGADLDFTGEHIHATLSWTRYTDQTVNAPLETDTDGYDMVDALVTYQIPTGPEGLSVFLKAENLLDSEARVHSSFIKDVAPRPGRNFALGIRGSF